MHISRLVVKNFRSLESVDVAVSPGVTVIIGENNVGKSNLIHALRVCLDVGLSSSYRTLLKEDIYSRVDITAPFQVLVGVEFAGFKDVENEEALLLGAQIAPDRARLFYRFRPKRIVREAIAAGASVSLTLDDFAWELAGGGNPAVDLASIEWNDELGTLGASTFQLQSLQNYQIVFMPALRDVETDLQQGRRSTLSRLIDSIGIDASEQKALIDIVSAANAKLEGSPTIKSIAEAIDASLMNITGPAFAMNVALGLSSPTFQSIVRNLIVLLSNNMLSSFEPRRNGLGMNNLLYIAILIEHFKRRAASGKSAGELLLVEEPESHLHPQLQNTLLQSLMDGSFQTVMTTHSAQVAAKAPLSSFIILTDRGKNPPTARVPAKASSLTAVEADDVERYLDATKSNLLFAKKVMLVEGAAELLLIPSLVRAGLDIDLERNGISVVAVHGTHFSSYAKLFSDDGMPKPCAIVGDADYSSEQEAALGDGDWPEKPNLADLKGPFVDVFLGATTFEKEISEHDNLAALLKTARELGAKKLAASLSNELEYGSVVQDAVKNQVLATAKRFGKARFAQVLARHLSEGAFVPEYIERAVSWLLRN